MIRYKWIVNTRNTIARLSGECDSAAAIEGAKMTTKEREELKALLRKAVNYIDNKIFK